MQIDHRKSLPLPIDEDFVKLSIEKTHQNRPFGPPPKNLVDRQEKNTLKFLNLPDNISIEYNLLKFPGII